MDTRTHYVPKMTRRDSSGREETICGQFITARQIAPIGLPPSCDGCRVWLDNLDHHSPDLVITERRTA